MTPSSAFQQWKPDTLVPTHEEAFEAGWKACMDFMEGRTWGNRVAMALSDGYNIIATESVVTAEVIYNAYPRKVGKQDAVRAISKAASAISKEQYLSINQAYEKLHGMVQAYAKATANWPAADKQFIPHPATWFNRGSYMDDPKEWQRGTPTTQQIRSQN